MDSNSPADPSIQKLNSSEETVEAGEAPESFPIVGVGASAGGFEAIRELLQNLPTDTGMAFVLVQHLDPKHESALTELLSRATKLAVSEVLQDVRVQPNRVYVIPPNAAMELQEGELHLTPRTVTRGRHMPIDQFLDSLAMERGSQAIAVILSGSASDGALGVTAIKAQGGITFAQDKTAKYDGMPRSAIATGHVDFVLTPKEIAQELTRIAKHPFLTEGRQLQRVEEEVACEVVQNELLTPLVLLREATGIDFTLYKHGTLKRRIQRRMALHNLESLECYVEYLRENRPEVQALYQDILINVTGFFRDPEAFDTLKSVVFSKLIEERAPDHPIRIWVPGCSTGEEVYSIAICLVEFLGDKASSASIKIFATDISDKSIDTARQGIYAQNISADVSPERLRRFFVESADDYQVIKTIREMCVFATQDLTKDPPFSNLDLISCRNVLIYFEPVLQKRVIPIFHYSLKPSGFLMLGTSEALGQSSDLFTLKEKRHKIYSKKITATHQAFDFPLRNRAVGAVVDRERDGERPIGRTLDISSVVDRFLVERYSPAGVVVNQNLKIVQVRGDTGPYLKLPPGEVSVDVLKMARVGLDLELRKALDETKKSGCPVRKEGLRVKTSEHYAGVSIEVVPLTARDAAEQCFFILFEEVPARPLRARKTDKGTLAKWLKSVLGAGVRREPPDERKEPKRSEQVRLLRAELDETRSHLQSLIQEHEAANEELRAANEEILSANEELLSTNEELETAKEELQATNEELGTVNEELRNRNLEMTTVNDDLTNLLSSVDIPILMLANDLRIRRFTPSAAKVFHLIPGDVGRPIGDLKPKINVPDVDKLIEEVISIATVREREVRDQEGRWHQMFIRPYWSQEKKRDGAVIVFFDINEIKRIETIIRESRDYAMSIVDTVREPLLVLNGDLHVIQANRAFYKMFKVSKEETVGSFIYDLGDRQWNLPKLRELLEKILPEEKEFHDFQVEHEFPNIGRKAMLINGRSLYSEGREKHHILLGIEDVTERTLARRKLLANQKRTGHRLQQSEAKTRSIVQAALEGIITIDRQGRIGSLNPAAERIFGYEAHEVTGKSAKMFMPSPHREEHDGYIANYLRTGEAKVIGVGREVVGLRKDGSTFPMELSVSEIDDHGRSGGFTAIVHDISERKRTEEALRASEETLRLLVDGVTDYAILMLDADGHIVNWNQGAARISGYQAEEIVGQNFSRFYAPEDIQRDKPGHQLRIAAAEGRFEDEDWRVRKDGSRFWANVVITALSDQDGQLRGFSKVTRDMTERKQAQEALLQSERLAAIGEAMAGLSHESGNALQRSQSSLQSLRRKVKGRREALNLIGEIQKAQDDLHRLYEEVREYAKPLALHLELHHLGKILHEAWEQLEPLREERESRLQESSGKLDLRCEVDKYAIQQVFRNVLENALHACADPTEIEVEYSEAEVDGQPAVRAALRDNGPGLTPEQRLRIFDSFYTTKEHGSGLGMAIAKRLVESHRGKIAVGASSGRGTEILIRLPRSQV